MGDDIVVYRLLG